jgi:hypothetical protein
MLHGKCFAINPLLRLMAKVSIYALRKYWEQRKFTSLHRIKQLVSVTEMKCLLWAKNSIISITWRNFVHQSVKSVSNCNITRPRSPTVCVEKISETKIQGPNKGLLSHWWMNEIAIWFRQDPLEIKICYYAIWTDMNTASFNHGAKILGRLHSFKVQWTTFS